MHYSWSSPSFPKLLAEDYPLNITSDEASYVTIIFPIGDIFGAPIGAIFADIIGRKKGILLIAVPAFIAWMFIAFAQNVYMLYIGRFIAGLGDGLIFIVYPMYVGEITEPKIRGMLGCSLSLAMIVGMISINAYAPFLSITNAALVSSIFPVILVFIFIWMPESPYFFLMKNNYEEARNALTTLRRCDVEEELAQMKKDVDRQMSERGSVKDLIYNKSNRKSLFIMLGIRSVQQFSGISALSLFTQTIFIQAGGNISPIIATIFYLIAQLIMTFSGSVLLEKYGRKPLLIGSAIGSGIMLFVAGSYFFLKEMTNIDVSYVSWLPLAVMIGYIIVYSIGLGTVPSLLLSEMFSASIKGKALCVMAIYYAAMISITSKLFYFLTETFGMFSAFYTFGTSCLVSVFFLYFFIPETKGKTLEAIQQDLKNKKPNNNEN